MEEQQKLPILHLPGRTTPPRTPKGILRIENGVTSFEEAVWCVVDAFREAEEYARQCGDHRWADEIKHIGDLFRADAVAFLDGYARVTWQAEDDDERLRLAVEEYRSREGEFVTLILDALADPTWLAFEPDDMVETCLADDPALAVHALAEAAVNSPVSLIISETPGARLLGPHHV